ncbi:MAG: YerC/YecD family TrpR-related protein [Patescibacteria group bacterium]
MDWSHKENKRLIQAILILKTSKETSDFLRDILTEKEIKEIARRLQAAEMLSKNILYSEIARETGFSSTTIARVSKWLNNGKGGYKNILDKLSHHDSVQKKRELS